MSPDPRDLARRTAALAGAHAVQVTVTRTSTATLRFSAEGAGDQVVGDALSVHVLALHDGHPGAAVAPGTGDAELAATLEEATRAAASAAAPGAPGPHPGLPGPQPVRTHAGYDPATARHELGPAEVMIAAIVEAAGTFELDGTWTTRANETAIASSTGLDLHDRTTRAVLDVTAREVATGRTGAARSAATSAGAIDAVETATRALAPLLPGEPVAVEPGSMPAVLGPEAVAAVLTFLGRTAFDGLAHAEGRGALSGRLGTRVAASAINLSDSPRFHRTLPAASTSTARPRRPCR